jgi:hypothetical protein
MTPDAAYDQVAYAPNREQLIGRRIAESEAARRRRGETSRVAYNPAHHWYYFSDMQPGEVLFIQVHDSANDGRARLSFHTSFDNPLTPGAPPREGIEVRTLVFFPPDN